MRFQDLVKMANGMDWLLNLQCTDFNNLDHISKFVDDVEKLFQEQDSSTSRNKSQDELRGHLASDAAIVEDLQNAFNEDLDVGCIKIYPVNVLANFLKAFLQNLKEPLMIPSFKEFLKTMAFKDDFSIKNSLLAMATEMPHYELFEKILYHLARVAMHSDINMSEKSLYELFAPIIFNIKDFQTQQIICLEILISEYKQRIESNVVEDVLQSAGSPCLGNSTGKLKEDNSNTTSNQGKELSHQLDSINKEPAYNQPDIEKDNIGTAEDSKTTEVDQPLKRFYLDKLEEFFGHTKFKDSQLKVIESVLSKKEDHLLIMPTGSGKSLCFQFPPVITGKMAVIISPLISLIENQVYELDLKKDESLNFFCNESCIYQIISLRKSNVKAAFLGANQENPDTVKKELFEKKFHLLYITPEYFISNKKLLQDLDIQIGIQLIAVDEAHCVVQWNDFRSAYNELKMLKTLFPDVPILALTASATLDSQKKIAEALGLFEPVVTRSNPDRPNIYLAVEKRTNQIELDIKRCMVQAGNHFCFEGQTIIYCGTKKMVNAVTIVLKELGVMCSQYHADLTIEQRSEAHLDFLKNKIQVIVSTSAFGLGINKKDISMVVHYESPCDLETYFQEMGRAGRAGQQSLSVIFSSQADFTSYRLKIAEKSKPEMQEILLKRLIKMETYLSVITCRRKFILSYFATNEIGALECRANCCDLCRERALQGQTVDFTQEAKLLFSAIEITGNCHGLLVPSAFLRGSGTPNVKKYSKNNLFGTGKNRSLSFWQGLGKALIFEEYLNEKCITGLKGTIVVLNDKARNWFHADTPLLLVPVKELLSEGKSIQILPLVENIPQKRKWSLEVELDEEDEEGTSQTPLKKKR